MRDINTENSLIGDLIQLPHLFIEAAEVLSPEDFLSPRCKKVYEEMLELTLEGKEIDIVSLSERLKGKVKTSEIIDLQDQAVGTTNFITRCYFVKEQWLSRQLKETGNRLVSKINDYDDPIEALSWTDNQVREFYNSITTKSIEKNSTVFDEVIKNYDKVKGGELLGLPSGISDLDNMLSGFQRGLFYLIGARPALGKSLLLSNIGAHVAKRGVPVVLFSLEMSPGQIMARVVCSELNINATRLKMGSLTPEEETHLRKGKQIFESLPFYISEEAASTPVDLITKIRKLKRDKDIGLVLVDYLQLMRSPQAESREKEISQIARSLKNAAKELKLPIIAATQLNRLVELRESKRPMLADLKESGEQEAAADVVILIHRPEVYGMTEFDNEMSCVGVAELRVAKQRDGEVGDIYTHFNKEYLRFSDLVRKDYDL